MTPFTRTSEPSMIYFSKLLPFQVACWETAAISTPVTRTTEPSLIYFRKLLLSGGMLGDGSHSHHHHQDFRAISDLFQQAYTFSGSALGDGSHSHHHHHDGSAPVGVAAAAPPPPSAAPSPAFSPAAPYVQAAAAPPPLPASYAPENLAYASEHSGKTTFYFSQY